MRKRSRAATVVVVGLVLLAHLSHAAFAGFNDRTQSASMSISTASLAPATGVAASKTCVLLVPAVTVSWTATTSGFAAGYRVYRRPTSGGSFTLLGTASGASTTSYTDSTVVGGSSYVYVLHAYYASWTAPSNEASVSVPLVCV